MTEEITKKKVKADDEAFEYDENLNIYHKDSGRDFHVSELYNDDELERELFREEAYEYMVDSDKLYKLRYDDSLKIPNSNIELLDDRDLPELKKYNTGLLSTKVFYINGDFDTIYVRKDIPKNILLYAIMGLGYGKLVDLLNIQSTILFYITIIVGAVLLPFLIYYIIKKTRNLHRVYDIREYDVSNIDKLSD